jgi:hypothetical protein
MKIREIFETATAGATSSGNIATVDAPHLSPGKARGKKSYIGEPGGPAVLKHHRSLNLKKLRPLIMH